MIPEAYLDNIVTGDARELSKAIPDASVDLVFTDPPYPKEYLSLFEWLPEESARILKPGGSCLVLSGNQYFDRIFPWFCKRLTYHWLNAYCMPTGAQTLRFWPKRIFNMWKPVLWFTKGQRISHNFVTDGVLSLSPDKRFHRWGQPECWAIHWIERVVGPGAVVFDPFCGGGTVPAVCKMLGRHYICFEINPETAERARQRVANAQPPLFVELPEQLELWATGGGEDATVEAHGGHQSLWRGGDV